MNHIKLATLRTGVTLILFGLVGCAPAAPTATPDYSAPPPNISEGFYVENKESITVNLPREQFLNWKDKTDLSEILTATEGMPAVERTVVLSGGE